MSKDICLYNEDINNKSLCLIAIGVFMPLYVELFFLFWATIMLYGQYGKCFSSSILKYLLIVFTISFITSTAIGYNHSKMIQQITALTVFFLLYEQFFKRNKNNLSDLFKKYITACYFICVIGLIQEVVYIFTHINILSLLPGYFASHMVTTGILRITSTLSEGGWLGTSLIPTIIYIFYYNDPYSLLNKKKKSIILIVALLTLSPFVYMSLFIIVLIKLNNKFRYAKRIMGIVTVCFVCYLFVNIVQTDHEEKKGALNHIFMRIGDTYKVIINMNENELADILAFSGNASTSVIATNMYIGFYAPSRLFGTGIGTNAQNYAKIVDSENSFELNADDGYSLFNRILSELGIVGLSLYLFFVYKHFNKRNMINICFFFMIMGLFMRGGNYMLYGTIFIHFMYYYTSKFNLSLPNGQTNINNHSNF